MSVLNIPPSIPKDKISSNGTKVTIKASTVKLDVQTPLGRVNKALTVECNIEGDQTIYSYLFSIDKGEIAGSAGRILSRIGVKNVSEVTDALLKQKLAGQVFTVENKSGKLYWR